MFICQKRFSFCIIQDSKQIQLVTLKPAKLVLQHYYIKKESNGINLAQKVQIQILLLLASNIVLQNVFTIVAIEWLSINIFLKVSWVHTLKWNKHSSLHERIYPHYEPRRLMNRKCMNILVVAWKTFKTHTWTVSLLRLVLKLYAFISIIFKSFTSHKQQCVMQTFHYPGPNDFVYFLQVCTCFTTIYIEALKPLDSDLDYRNVE